METEDYDNYDDIAVTKYKTYGDFLDKFVTFEDKLYLEDDELARDIKELYAVNKGDIKNKEDFDNKKREHEILENQEEVKEKPSYSEGKEFKEGSFLWHLQQREYEVRNGRKSTIIFIRYKDHNGKETSAYIDYRERLKNDNFEQIFNEEKDLVPRSSDLSFYNWSIQRVYSNDSTFFRVDAGAKERLSFRNNTDRKIINVDLEYIHKHKHDLDVKRLSITPPNTIADSNDVTVTQVKNANAEESEGDAKEQFCYQQIVIFDYETRSK